MWHPRPVTPDVIEDDESIGFDEVERRHVRHVVGISDFDWVRAGAPSPRNLLLVPLAEALATVSITQVPAITRIVQPSLAAFVAHPFGLTLGADDVDTHDAVLSEATRVHPAGTIVPLPFRWPDDLRRRQLSKQR